MIVLLFCYSFFICDKGCKVLFHAPIFSSILFSSSFSLFFVFHVFNFALFLLFYFGTVPLYPFMHHTTTLSYITA